MEVIIFIITAVGGIAAVVQIMDYLEKRRERSTQTSQLTSRTDSGGRINPLLTNGGNSNNARFVGREDAIAALHKLINGGAKVILIRGPGGVGKTTLAWNYLKRYQPDTLLELWMAKETFDITPVENRVEEWLKGDLGTEPGGDFGISLERLRDKLRDPNKKIAVLIDNLEPALDNRGQVIEQHRRYVRLLQVLSDPAAKSITIITSREHLREPSIALTDYYLTGLEMAAWEKYFDTLDLDAQADVIQEMHAAYGGNPKAMHIIAGASGADYAGDVNAYWKVHKSNLLSEPELENLIRGQFERIRQISLPAYNLLCRLGCFRYQDIKSIPLDGVLQMLWDMHKDQRLRIFNALRDRSLVEFDGGKCWLHPAIRSESVVRLRDTPDWVQSNQTAAAYWSESVKTINTTSDALQALESYYHHIAIENYEAAGEVILQRRSSPDRDLSKGGEPLDAAFYRLGLLQLQVSIISRIVDKLTDSFVKGCLYDVMGLSYRHLGKIAEAIECYTEIERISKTLDSLELSVRGLTLISYCKTDLWEIDEAIASFESLVAVSEGTAFQRYCVLAWAYLAFLFSTKSIDFSNAAHDYHSKASNSLDRKDLNTWRKAYALMLLGIAQHNLGDEKGAKERLNLSIAKSRENNHPQAFAKALTFTAIVFATERDFEQALRSLLKAVKLLDRLSALTDLGEAYMHLGRIYVAMGRQNESHSAYRKSLDIFQKTQAPAQIRRVHGYMQDPKL